MELQGLLRDLLAELAEPDFWGQALALLLCQGSALGLSRFGRGRWGVGQHGHSYGLLRRLAFPLLGMLLLVPAREALKPFMHTNLLKVAFSLLFTLALVRGTIYILRQAFSPSGWLAASERLVVMMVWGALALHLTGLAPGVVEALESVSFKVGKQSLDLWMILHGLVTVFATVLLALWLSGVLEARLMAAEQVDSSVRVVLARIAKAVLTLLAILLSLSLVGIDITTLSVFGGALGVGLGFGLQKIASNYVSGFIILLDRSIRLGNVIAIDAQTTGVVTQITTRYTVLRSLAGVEYLVPNESLVSQTVQNHSFTDSKVFLKTSIGIGYNSDVEQAMQLFGEVAARHPRVLADPAPRAFLTAFGDSAITIEVGFWIADPEVGTGGIRSDINVALWRACREHGIDIPFPQREVRLLS